MYTTLDDKARIKYDYKYWYLYKPEQHPTKLVKINMLLLRIPLESQHLSIVMKHDSDMVVYDADESLIIKTDDGRMFMGSNHKLTMRTLTAAMKCAFEFDNF